MEQAIQAIRDFIWGIPLIAIIVFIGIYLTIRLKGLQITRLFKAIKMLFEKDTEDKGEVSTFQAVCISLSATIGTGNITGVAMAIAIGGPGALFWMVISALLSMAIKYSEGFLAIKYRRIEGERIIGGPYAYIEYGLGSKWKPLAKAFSVFGMLCAILGIGTLTQINGINEAAINVFDKGSTRVINIFGMNVTIVEILTTLIISTLSALVLIGGVKRIGRVCEYLVPIMAIIYISICFLIIIVNIKDIPTAFTNIISMAFNKNAFIGGMVGKTVLDAISNGVAKGVFSNEAGLGSAPIATATAKSSDPIKEGLVCMTTTFFGTVVICTLTGLCIVLTNAWDIENLKGINITDYAFTSGLSIFPPLVASIFVLISITCFAFTTIIGWNLYGYRCLDYLTKGNKKYNLIYQIIYILILVVSPCLSVEAIWNIADILNAFMALPNLLAILLLSNVIVKDTNNYFINNKSTNT